MAAIVIERERGHVLTLKAGIKQHWDGVIDAVLTNVTNARSEVVNKIQWIKRLGCGYRNRERFRNAIYFHLGGLDLYPDAMATHTKS